MHDSGSPSVRGFGTERVSHPTGGDAAETQLRLAQARLDTAGSPTKLGEEASPKTRKRHQITANRGQQNAGSIPADSVEPLRHRAIAATADGNSFQVHRLGHQHQGTLEVGVIHVPGKRQRWRDRLCCASWCASLRLPVCRRNERRTPRLVYVLEKTARAVHAALGRGSPGPSLGEERTVLSREGRLVRTLPQVGAETPRKVRKFGGHLSTRFHSELVRLGMNAPAGGLSERRTPCSGVGGAKPPLPAAWGWGLMPTSE